MVTNLRSDGECLDRGHCHFRSGWEIADLVIILMVVVLNAILGVVQEGKAEKAIEALQKMASHTQG